MHSLVDLPRAYRRGASVLAGVVCLAVLAVACGCGRNLPDVAPVAGRVTFGGKPVEGGTIQFWPESGVPARGTITPDGSYRLSTFSQDDGAVLGPHTVTIEATQVHYGGPEINSIEEEMEYYSRKDAAPLDRPVIERLVPERYSKRDASGLTATVEPKENTIDFDLPAEP